MKLCLKRRKLEDAVKILRFSFAIKEEFENVNKVYK